MRWLMRFIGSPEIPGVREERTCFSIHLPRCCCRPHRNGSMPYFAAAAVEARAVNVKRQLAADIRHHLDGDDIAFVGPGHVLRDRRDRRLDRVVGGSALPGSNIHEVWVMTKRCTTYEVMATLPISSDRPTAGFMMHQI